MSTTTEESTSADEAIIARGDQIYEGSLKKRLEASHKGRFVGIDPDSGNYFLGDIASEALWAAHKAMPKSQFYVRRIGYEVTHRLGSYDDYLLGSELLDDTQLVIDYRKRRLSTTAE